MKTEEKVFSNLSLVRQKSPLVHNITNYVVMNPTANALLAAGASPVMAHAVEEAEDMAAIASALVINIGTLSPSWVEAMHIAMNSARDKGIPVVFDPVGAGATYYRNQAAKELISSVPPDIIRGNASEIQALYSVEAKSKGVDTTRESESAVDAGRHLSENYNCVTVISGQVDYIVAGDRVESVSNGTALMARVTGMGCTASALIGAFAGVNPDPAEAAVSAMIVMGIAGQMAREKSSGPGTLQLHFLDCLYQMDEEVISKLCKHKTGYA